MVWTLDGKTYARTSVSWSLGSFNTWLGEHQVFVPTCVHRDVQTGGYGRLRRLLATI